MIFVACCNLSLFGDGQDLYFYHSCDLRTIYNVTLIYIVLVPTAILSVVACSSSEDWRIHCYLHWGCTSLDITTIQTQPHLQLKCTLLLPY